MADEKGNIGESTVSGPYSTLGTKGEKPGAGGSHFPKSASVNGVLATLVDAKPEVRSGFEWPATDTDKNHN